MVVLFEITCICIVQHNPKGDPGITVNSGSRSDFLVFKSLEVVIHDEQ